MNRRMVPKIVKTFVLGNIHSVEQLEILLFLRREPQLKWGVEDICSSIKTSQASVEARLTDLISRGLVSKAQDRGPPLFRYESDLDTKSAVDELAKFYATHRHTIIELIYSRPADSIRVFSAFRNRSDDDN